MPALLPRRRLLVVSATTLPLVLAASGCRSADAFAGPDPLSGRPPLSHDVVTLQAVIAAEQALIRMYRNAVAGRSAAVPKASVLTPLLAEHQQHLDRLRARLVVPSGAPESPSPPASGTAAPVTTATLRAAEHASAASLVQKLATVQPSLAQLLASIAASDATHVTVLGG